MRVVVSEDRQRPQHDHPPVLLSARQSLEAGIFVNLLVWIGSSGGYAYFMKDIKHLVYYDQRVEPLIGGQFSHEAESFASDDRS